MENTMKVLRAVKGVTQEQLAEDLGVTRQTI
ncbi:HTH domain-containing protein, partial [Candidatus Bathyarchaeota archaeon]